jgi:hypothetical protein
MKKITMTISVFVDDEPVSECENYSCPIERITHCLYEHICTWEFNVHGTVEVEDEDILDDAVIGVD